jgi:hypothetical protein
MTYELTPQQKKAHMDRAERNTTHQNPRPFTIHSNGKTRTIRRNDLDDLKLILIGVAGGMLFCLVSWLYMAI